MEIKCRKQYTKGLRPILWKVMVGVRGHRKQSGQFTEEDRT